MVSPFGEDENGKAGDLRLKGAARAIQGPGQGEEPWTPVPGCEPPAENDPRRHAAGLKRPFVPRVSPRRKPPKASVAVRSCEASAPHLRAARTSQGKIV